MVERPIAWGCNQQSDKGNRRTSTLNVKVEGNKDIGTEAQKVGTRPRNRRNRKVAERGNVDSEGARSFYERIERAVTFGPGRGLVAASVHTTQKSIELSVQKGTPRHVEGGACMWRPRHTEPLEPL